MIRAETKLSVTGQDNFDQLLKRMKSIQEAYVTIGFHDDAGEYPGGQSVVEVALWNEYGTDQNPARPFFASAMDENASLIQQWQEEVINGILDGKYDVEKGLEVLGFRIKTLVENKIKSNVPPPNAPSTVAHKQAEGVAPNTLIDTGLMLRSITFKVFLK